MSNESGQCPKCNGTNLEYGTSESYGHDGMEYPYECKDCNFFGVEWYTLEFDTHLTKNRMEVE